MQASELVWSILGLACYGIILGAAVQIAAAQAVANSRSLAVIIGVGLSVSMLAIALSYRLLGNATLPIIPLGALSLFVIAIRAWRYRGHIAGFRSGTSTDLVALAAALIVVLPVLKYGVSPWTNGTADFPSYAASAEIWTGSPVGFAARHPDFFGNFQLHRASFEKPMVTALLVLASAISRMKAYELLTPAMVVALFVLFGALIDVAKSLFRLNSFKASLAVLIPSLSIVPISRVYDAQIGQVVAVALCATFLAVLFTPAPRPGFKNFVPPTLIAAVVGTAALGSSFSLLAGASIVLICLVVLLVSIREDEHSYRISLLAGALPVAAVLSLPFVGMYVVSFGIQSSGEPGFPVPFPSPLAAIGQQLRLDSVSTTSQEMLAWAIAAVIAVLMLIAPWQPRRLKTAYAILLAGLILNLAVIIWRTGLTNYAVHKWFALAIALVVPLVAAHLASLASAGLARLLPLLLAPLACSSVPIALTNGEAVVIHMPNDLLALRENPELAKLDALNIQLADLHQNSFAPLIVQARVTNVVARTYAVDTPPLKADFLLPIDQIGSAGVSNVRRLNDSYVLASIDYGIVGNAIYFNDGNPGSRRYLSSEWSGLEDKHVWSTGSDSFVVLDIHDVHRNRDLSLDVIGSAYATTDEKQRIEFRVNGKPIRSLVYPDDQSERISLIVPKSLVDAGEGRIAITFHSDGLVLPYRRVCRIQGFWGSDSLASRSRTRPKLFARFGSFTKG